MLIALIAVVIGVFGIAGTFLTIEARRAAAISELDRRDSASDWSVAERSAPGRE
jgi:hypothetical protein